ncbi:hypothetical protein B296_00051640, partial [Ensete ventricosum]
CLLGGLSLSLEKEREEERKERATKVSPLWLHDRHGRSQPGSSFVLGFLDGWV